MKLTIALSFLVVMLTAGQSVAGQYNAVLDTGDTMPGWTDLPGVDGQNHSSETLADRAVVVVVFTCNSCPYARDLETRLKSFQRSYDRRGVTVVAINVNTIDEDSLPAMKRRAKEKKFSYPYLFDESQQIAKDFGAKFTPQCFVFDADQKLVYQGSFDDSPDGKQVGQTYVADAVEAAMKQVSPQVKETVPIGCKIRYQRERRRRSR